MQDIFKCPVCQTPLTLNQDNYSKTADSSYINCLRCGEFIISRSLLTNLPSILKDTTEIALLSHAIRKMQRRNEPPFLNTYSIEPILNTELPSLSEQINNLMLWLGNNTIPGHAIHQSFETVQSIIGGKTPANTVLVIDYLRKKELLNKKSSIGEALLELSMEGWQYYDNIKRGAVMSRNAFMAMKFGDKDLDSIFEKCFKPAVKATGFDLFRLDEHPRAGLIDDRLRVEIRNSRFLMSDLTHENAGAYWEAGFAEGLGKPVIYTCEKNKFDAQKTHFDTNHHLTIVWDAERLNEASEQLKATIRATLPDEAKFTDE